MEKKRCLWLFSPCTQKPLEGKSEMCERYAVPFAMQLDSSSFPVSLQPLTMALVAKKKKQWLWHSISLYIKLKTSLKWGRK